MSSKTITGSRAKIYVDGQLVGIFESCTVATSIGTEAIHILGRYSADEIAITSQEICTVTCSGFRVAGNGKHVLPKVPKIQDLLNFTPFTIAVYDRQPDAAGNQVILETITGCVPNNSNSNYNAKAVSKISVSYQGIRSHDESGNQDESAGPISGAATFQ